MRQQIDSDYCTDEKGFPSGGQTAALGLLISWQAGPDVNQPNGCLLETALEAVIDRVRFYQRSSGACFEFDEVLDHLSMAASALDRRRRHREFIGEPA